MLTVPSSFFSAQIVLHGTSLYLVDLAAFAVYAAAWFGYAAYADWQHPQRPSLMAITQAMRLSWMRQMIGRENRMVDAALIGNLQRSITFFASTSIFVLIGLVSMLGYRDKALDIIGAIPFALQTSPFMWEFKIFLMMFVFIYSFFKYTWSLRLYNYASIYVGATPPLEDCLKNPEESERYAQRGGALIANAGTHFNMGLRAYYFGLAVLSWFLHPLLFVATIGWVLHEVHRREFRSKTVNNLAEMAK
jgi:uncharacterized membrane protein